MRITHQSDFEFKEFLCWQVSREREWSEQFRQRLVAYCRGLAHRPQVDLTSFFLCAVTRHGILQSFHSAEKLLTMHIFDSWWAGTKCTSMEWNKLWVKVQPTDQVIRRSQPRWEWSWEDNTSTTTRLLSQPKIWFLMNCKFTMSLSVKLMSHRNFANPTEPVYCALKSNKNTLRRPKTVCSTRGDVQGITQMWSRATHDDLQWRIWHEENTTDAFLRIKNGTKLRISIAVFLFYFCKKEYVHEQVTEKLHVRVVCFRPVICISIVYIPAFQRKKSYTDTYVSGSVLWTFVHAQLAENYKHEDNLHL